MSDIGVINYGSGNFRSVWNALQYLQLPTKEVRTPSELADSSHLILPGVGSFAGCMSRLRNLGLDEPIREAADLGKPLLGICVGLQVLATQGLEFGVHEGLGIIPGEVRALDPGNLRLPHIGWNSCHILHTTELLDSSRETGDFYFLHSYHLVPETPQDVVAVSEYGEEVTAIVQRENVFGVQFHPEKSQLAGLGVLKRFSELN